MDENAAKRKSSFLDRNISVIRLCNILTRHVSATMPSVIASTQTMTWQGDFPCSFPLHGVDNIAWGGANFFCAPGVDCFWHAIGAFYALGHAAGRKPCRQTTSCPFICFVSQCRSNTGLANPCQTMAWNPRLIGTPTLSILPYLKHI